MSVQLDFYRNHESAKKTPEFKVSNQGMTLGWIKWYAQWRRLCFFPTPGTLFDRECLLRIAEEVSKQDSAYKKMRDAGKAGAR
jgi:hypothetical protein